MNSFFFLFVSGVLGTIAKLCKTCVLRITADKLYFILLEKVISGGTHTWCEVTQVTNIFICLICHILLKVLKNL